MDIPAYHHRFSTLSLLVAIFILLCSFLTSDSNFLSFNFLPGNIFRLNVYSNQQIKQTMMGKDQLTSNETRIDYIFRVLNAGKDQYLLDLQMDSIWIRMNISGEKVEGNSSMSLPRPGILSKSLAEISKKHLKINLTPVGDVLSVSGADTLYYGVIDSYLQVPEQVKTELKEALDQKFGNDAFLLELKNILNIYTSKSIKAGSHWQSTVPLSAGLPGLIQNTWTLVEKMQGSSDLTASGIVTPPAKNDFRKYDGIMMKYELNGTNQARYSVDPLTGWIYSARINESIGGIVRLQGSTAMPQGISWPITIEWTIVCAGNKLR